MSLVASHTVGPLSFASVCTPAAYGNQQFTLNCAARITNMGKQSVFLVAADQSSDGSSTLTVDYTLAPGQSADLPQPSGIWVGQYETRSQAQIMVDVFVVGAIGLGALAGLGAWAVGEAIHYKITEKRNKASFGYEAPHRETAEQVMVDGHSGFTYDRSSDVTDRINWLRGHQKYYQDLIRAAEETPAHERQEIGFWRNMVDEIEKEIEAVKVSAGMRTPVHRRHLDAGDDDISDSFTYQPADAAQVRDLIAYLNRALTTAERNAVRASRAYDEVRNDGNTPLAEEWKHAGDAWDELSYSLRTGLRRANSYLGDYRNPGNGFTKQSGVIPGSTLDMIRERAEASRRASDRAAERGDVNESQAWSKDADDWQDILDKFSGIRPHQSIA